MSKKHFVALAHAMALTKPRPVPTKDAGAILRRDYNQSLAQWTRDVHQIANVAGDSNSSFDYHHFVSACGLE